MNGLSPWAAPFPFEKIMACVAIAAIITQYRMFARIQGRYSEFDGPLVSELCDRVNYVALPAFFLFGLCVLLEFSEPMPALLAIGRIATIDSISVTYYHLSGFSEDPEHRWDATMVAIYRRMAPLLEVFIGIYDSINGIEDGGIDRGSRITLPVHSPFIIHAASWFIRESSYAQAKDLTFSFIFFWAMAVAYFSCFGSPLSPWVGNLSLPLGFESSISEMSPVVVKILAAILMPFNFGIAAEWILNVRSPYEEGP